MKTVTAEEFFMPAGHCSQQEQAKFRAFGEDTVQRAREKEATHLVRYEVLDMWSSHFGEAKILMIGPGLTVQTLEEASGLKLDMESIATTKWPTTYMEIPKEE